MNRSPLGVPVQVAYAVADVHAAADAWVRRTGAGPFFVVEHIPLATARVDGRAGEFDHSSAYAQWGPMMVELVQEHTAPLVEPGRVHHVAFMVDDLAAARVWCLDAGWHERLWARTAGGQAFAFLDATADIGHLVELYEPSSRLVAFYARVADAAIDWDGSDPVRSVG